MSGTALSDRVPWGGATFGEVLLEPTVIYVRRILKLLSQTDNVRVPPPPPGPRLHTSTHQTRINMRTQLRGPSA